jgi:hypothetical protein
MTTGTLVAAAVISEATEAVTTAIPAAYLAAFAEGGTVAASGLATLASVAALPLAVVALGYSAYDYYKTLQQAKVIDAAIAASQAEVAATLEAAAQYSAVHSQYLNSVQKLEQWAQDTAGATVPQTGKSYVTETLTEAAPAVIEKQIYAPTKKAAVVAKPAKAVTTTQQVLAGETPVTVNVTALAPAVTINEAAIPQPLAIAGPLTAVQFAALIPAIATQTAIQDHAQTQRCLASTGAALLSNVLKALIPAGIAAGFLFNDTLRNAMSSVAQKFVDAIYSPLTSQAPITPEKAPGIGAVLLAEAVGFGAGAHILAVTAEASAPLKNMGLGYLAAFMADAAGFSRIAAAYQGMMIQWGLQQPMRYWALSHFRPMIPTEGNLLKLLANYAITSDEFKKYMVYHGYSDEWIAKLPDIAYKSLTPMLFRYLGEAGILDDEFIDAELRHAEYRPEAIPRLKEWLARVSAGELKGQFAGAVTSAYGKGLLSPDDLKAHLGNLGYSEAQRDKGGYAAELSFATNIAEEMRAVYLQQHKQGQINDGELKLQLSTLGYRPEKVSADVLKARAWFKPKPATTTDAAAQKVFLAAQAKYVQGYIDLYRKEYLDDAGLYNALVSVMVDPQVAEATVFLESAKTLPKLAE